MADKKSTLYELTGEWLELYDMADDPDIDADTWFDTMEAVEGELEDKADGYAKVIAQLNADTLAIKGEEERLYNRRKTIENRIKYMKDRLQQMMEMTGKTKFKTAMHSFGISKNPQSVYIFEGAEIPDTYLIPQEPKIDKKAILADLKAGKTFDFAELQQTDGLRIR